MVMELMVFVFQLTFACGLILTGAACLWMWFLGESNRMQVFGVAIFMGAGSSTLLVTSLSMVADLIGVNTVIILQHDRYYRQLIFISEVISTGI